MPKIRLKFYINHIFLNYDMTLSVMKVVHTRKNIKYLNKLMYSDCHFTILILWVAEFGINKKLVVRCYTTIYQCINYARSLFRYC